MKKLVKTKITEFVKKAINRMKRHSTNISYLNKSLLNKPLGIHNFLIV